MRRIILLTSLFTVTLLLAGCASRPRVTAPAAAQAVAPASADAVVAEAWVSAPHPEEEVDSIAVWPTEDGGSWLIVTAKQTEQLVVFDAQSGRRLRTVGSSGSALGQFKRPNGIAVFGDLVFVAERDNHRVQVLQLPDFTPLAAIGERELKVPYGLWLHEVAPDELELLVTDSFMADFRTRALPPMAELDQRVKRYRVAQKPDGSVSARYLGAFGDTSEAGALRMVESIAGDPANDRLLIADEDVRVGSTLRDYTLGGRYRGRSLPRFQADAEGVSLWACDTDQAGYWIASDQLTPTLFRVYDRVSLAPVGTFSGKSVGDTDGQALYATPSARFPAGALYVQSRNESVAAFDLRDIAAALKLAPACVE
ncbi:phytase [Pseudoxanthomonas composti]|uniref:Phytase n=1 Tax=Pseudoxanthomonas composti TaxID=2137479 RepID=A0A4Q1JZC2_9GAMM|nr:phytase [Pseudoxanthomonas composti]RXR08690.1 phytase [Pseudoxanthomonas composti]